MWHAYSVKNCWKLLLAVEKMVDVDNIINKQKSWDDPNIYSKLKPIDLAQLIKPLDTVTVLWKKWKLLKIINWLKYLGTRWIDHDT